MDEKETIKRLIYKLSDIYREQARKVDRIQEQIFQLSNSLEEANISHKRYLKIQDDLTYLKQNYTEEKLIAKGIKIAREELLNEL